MKNWRAAHDGWLLPDTVKPPHGPSMRGPLFIGSL